MLSKSIAILLALTITSTLAIPALPQSSNITSATLNLSDTSPFHCVKTTFLSPFKLPLHACIQAIYELPSSPQPGTFHLGLPYDIYSLPVTEVVGRCKVTVEMAVEVGVVEDRGTWLQMGLLARDLNAICESRLGVRYQGGWVRGVEKGGVVVRFGLAGHGASDEKGDGEGKGEGGGV